MYFGPGSNDWLSTGPSLKVTVDWPERFDWVIETGPNYYWLKKPPSIMIGCYLPLHDRFHMAATKPPGCVQEKQR